MEEATTHQVFIPRLRANTRYEFEVKVFRGSSESEPLRGAFQTDSLPRDLAAVRFTARGEPTTPLTLLHLRQPFYCAIVDRDGEVVWFYPAECQGATRRTNGNFVLLDATARYMYDVGPDGRLQNRLAGGVAVDYFHHDVVATPRNTVYILTLEPKTYGDTVWWGESIWEWAPETGVPTKRWTSHDAFTPSTDRGIRSVPIDWLHANSLNVGPSGNVLVSFHFLDQIISIAPDFSRVEWRIGGPNSTHVPAPNAFFSGQHTASQLANGNILLFDNGYARADGGRWSRALELELVGNQARAVWEYRPTPDIWARFISSARRLPNGNTLIGFGPSAGQLGSTGPVSAREVTRSGHAIWTLIIENAGSIFRADPVASIDGEGEVRPAEENAARRVSRNVRGRTEPPIEERL